jgi:hypothetical protein
MEPLALRVQQVRRPLLRRVLQELRVRLERRRRQVWMCHQDPGNSEGGIIEASQKRSRLKRQRQVRKGRVRRNA